MMSVKIRAIALALAIAGWMVIAGGAQQTTISISITSPLDGYQTVAPEVTVEGSITSGLSNVSLVLVTVNGEAQKVSVGSEGAFQTTVSLQRGQNLISAIAVSGNQEVASTKIHILRQNQVLFLDDFEGREKRSEWADAAGNWKVNNGTFTLEQKDWRANTSTYISTSDSRSWRDYQVEVDINASQNTRHGGVILRAQDDANKMVFRWKKNHYYCFKVVKNDNWSDCLGKTTPGPTKKVHLRVVVEGQTYTAYVNGIKLTTIRDDTFSQGMPGLYLFERWSNFSFDNFKVTSLAPGEASSSASTENEKTTSAELPSGSKEDSESKSKSSTSSNQESSKSTSNLAPKLNQLDSQVRENRQRIDTLRSRNSKLSSEISSIQSTIDQLDSQQQSLTNRLNSTNKQVAELESKISQFPTEIPEKLKNINSSLGQLEQLEAKNQRQLGENRKRLDELNNKIGRLQGTTQYALILGGAGTTLAVLIGIIALNVP